LKHGNIILAVTFGAMFLCLLDAFFRQLRYDPYSYNTILYAGFALFVLFLFGTHVWASIRNFSRPEEETVNILYVLVHSAKNYMLLTSPLLLLFSGVLFVSNVALIRHEGLRFVNVLGMILALLLVAGAVLVGILDLISALSTDGVLISSLAVNLIAALYPYFECMLVGAAVADVIAARYMPDRDKDYLIVLGCGLKKDGTPTPLLRGRLDLALRFDHRQRQERGKKARYVVSGGQGPDEVQSEAESMRDYLVDQGISPERIMLEDKSTDTAENMRFSKAVIEGQKQKWRRKGKIAYFTTNYHVFRSGLKARQAGMQAEGMGAPTKWYFWPNAAVREFVGLLTEHKLKQSLVILGLLFGYGLLTVLAYA
jgi:uncharacterized SAM-binding protein YcdF (DUF218 family)